MPTDSSFQTIDIPDVDLWAFLFERKNRDFSDDQVIYRSSIGDRKYTYKEVKKAATSFGEGLQESWEWQRGDVLNIYAPNDIDVAPIIFGTFFAGGIVSPANPGYSPDELAFQLSSSESKAIATTKAFLPAATKAAKKANIPENRIILLGEERDPNRKFRHWTDVTKASLENRYRRKKASNPSKDLAFLVYSSGTTGLPKGVMLSHSNVVADLCQIKGSVGHYYQSGQDKILGVLPFFHIYGLTGLVHQPLHRGIELVVMPAFDLKLFLESVQKHKITFIYVAPPVIVRLARDEMVKNYDLSSIKMITSGAAPLTRELVDTVHKKLNIKINQAYGLSETSPMTHTQSWDEWYSSVGSVGKIFPNMTAKYMSEDGKELPAGEAGELWMAGPNIFQGYWKNEEATQGAIVEADGLRYFKTGDVGFQDEKHNFYITDRVKELIKYKGFQVAPAELEGKLMDHPLVNDIAVIGVEDKEMHTEVPRAYIVHAKKAKEAGDPETGAPNKDFEKDAQSIIDWTAEKVANHKRLRGGVRFIEEIPKSASGKILRRMLKERVKKESAPVKAKL
ncbi:putative 4-coumarate--CoA ligase 1 [Fulvia fulva]|uniref:4-coumarate--CoA ligase 1 n=1 Tax=Passalora fulva TaxID=5499 RepID=A0A9Q8PLR1_PASFU|nr:putative 4-coumarate--CoA ligase 1 [Fulvia fulva]KAK4610687.1 putative 4-coumarate--CoA ligase 1 [Fulvia fulva]KAK4610888.1 putative 4-coumarate--CoA ligase 1 [Fulvia fulva]UJO24752.1 putative 4-coumarate--CoA ligase 1 [Fulvia fulva]WPV22059.1 putative 4-coumarate--CoA ligase 1 [Fulvia fulva]WPV37313.1 putative 4-coumarate--CoA ligase 1 [Fulvia fulva]